MSAPDTKPMNSQDLFALPPSKKVDRWLFRGELRVSKVTKRNPAHCRVTAAIGALLWQWLRQQPQPRGVVYTGEAYFRIRREPETNVGIDVALASPEQTASTKKKASFVEGAPILAVEVLSPNDEQKDITEAIEEYLDCGVKQVWIIEPYAETVMVYRSGVEPVLFTRSQVLTGGEDLPGFQCPVAQIFE
jgi:Uma2 family endonuclease